MFLLTTAKRLLDRYPVCRGMLTYSAIWPLSNVVQQSMDSTREKLDVMEVCRFSVFGTFVTAPTVYIWVRMVSKMVTGNTFRHALLKAACDITFFAPVGQTQFYFGMSALEGKPLQECVQEVKDKLIPSWKVGACFWPFVQTFNFAYVAERNRVMVVSIGSCLWTMFLSYMHHTNGEGMPEFFKPNPKTENTKTENTITEKNKDS